MFLIYFKTNIESSKLCPKNEKFLLIITIKKDEKQKRVRWIKDYKLHEYIFIKVKEKKTKIMQTRGNFFKVKINNFYVNLDNKYFTIWNMVVIFLS